MTRLGCLLRLEVLGFLTDLISAQLLKDLVNLARLARLCLDTFLRHSDIACQILVKFGSSGGHLGASCFLGVEPGCGSPAGLLRGRIQQFLLLSLLSLLSGPHRLYLV